MHDKDGVKKKGTDLSDEERLGRTVRHSTNSCLLSQIPCRVPIGIREAGYQSNHNVSGLKVILVLPAPPNSIQEANIMMGKTDAI